MGQPDSRSVTLWVTCSSLTHCSTGGWSLAFLGSQTQKVHTLIGSPCCPLGLSLGAPHLCTRQRSQGPLLLTGPRGLPSALMTFLF